jgi:hypothetical protein
MIKKLFLIISYVPLAYLIYLYGGHGIVEAMIEQDEYLEIIGSLGLGSAITFGLLICTGLLDTFVAVLLIAKDKIWPALPTGYLFLWAGLWPIVPRLLEWHGGMDPEPMVAVSTAIVAALAYAMHRLHHVRSGEHRY